VADLFQPVNHVDGEVWDATDVNRLESGIEALDVSQDTLTDRVDALYAAGGPGGGSGQGLSGPRSHPTRARAPLRCCPRRSPPAARSARSI